MQMQLIIPESSLSTILVATVVLFLIKSKCEYFYVGLYAMFHEVVKFSTQK